MTIENTMNSDIDQMHFLVLHIGKAYCMKDWNYKDVCSPFTRLYYVVKGHAQIQLPDKIQDLYPDHMYIVPAFTPHSYICDEEFVHYYIHVYNESEHDVLDDLILPTEIETEEYILMAIQHLCELCPNMELQQYEPKTYDNTAARLRNLMKNKQRTLADRVESRAIIYLLLARFIRMAHPKHYAKDERIKDVLNYIHTNISKKISMDSLIDIACMSEDYFIRLFKKEIYMTPISYITKKKVEKAQLRLVTGNETVKEIAFQLGFESQEYFNRVFKKYTGLTPLSYRRSY